MYFLALGQLKAWLKNRNKNQREDTVQGAAEKRFQKVVSILDLKAQVLLTLLQMFGTQNAAVARISVCGHSTPLR